LLVLMTAVAVACSWLAVEMQRAERQRNAVEAIARDSRDVWYDYQVDTPPCLMNKRAKPPAPAWLRHVLGDDFFCDTAVVNWCVKPMDDATLVYIKELTALRFLYLNYGEATDAGLGNLKALTQLETLELPGTVVGDAGLEHLKGLTALQHLDLSETEISDAGLVHLKGLTRLRELWLADTRISDVGLEHLYGLSELTQLDLRGTRVTGAGIQKLHRALPQCLIGE
jgi:Leucine-rich repeat (LRR) protein